MFKNKYAEQEEQDRIDKLAAYTTGDAKGEVGIGAWSDEVNIEDAINSLDQSGYASCLGPGLVPLL
jgi:hypothetical protein